MPSRLYVSKVSPSLQTLRPEVFTQLSSSLCLLYLCKAQIWRWM